MGTLSEDEHARLQFAFESMRSVITALTEEKIDLEEKNEELNEGLERSKTEIQNLQSQLNEINSNRKRHDEGASALIAKKMEQMQKDHEILNSDLKENKILLAGARTLLNEKESDIESLQAKILEMKENKILLDGARTLLNQKESEIESLQAKILGMKCIATNESSSNESRIQNLRSVIEKMMKLEKTVSEKDVEIEKLTETLEETKIQLIQRKETIKLIAEERNLLLSERKEFVREKEFDVENLKKELDEIRRENDELRNLEKENVLLKKEMSGLNLCVKDLRDAEANMETHYETLNCKLEEHKVFLAEARYLLSDKDFKIKGLKKKVEERKERKNEDIVMQKIKRKNDELEKENAMLLKKISEMNSYVKQLHNIEENDNSHEFMKLSRKLLGKVQNMNNQEDIKEIDESLMAIMQL